MKVDGIRVANDGSIPFRAGERVALKYYMSQLFPEDEVGNSCWNSIKRRGTTAAAVQGGDRSSF